MKLLAFETSGEACSVALYLDGEIAQRICYTPRRHGELVLEMAQGLLADAGIGLAALDALAFGQGPGSFTGVRIAAAVVQGAAFGAGLPAVPVSTLAAMAQGAFRRAASRQTLVALDARMDQVYWGAYRLDGAGCIGLDGDESVLAPDFVPPPRDGGWFGVGNGWQAHGARLRARLGDRLNGCDPDLVCEAQDIAQIAVGLFRQGGGVTAEAAMPVYLRDQVVSVEPPKRGIRS